MKVGILAGLIMEEEHLIPKGPAAPLPTNTTSNLIPTSETLVGTSLHPTGQPVREASFSSDGPSFLLLDVRLAEDYEACRIVGAITYPAAVLTHAMNYFTTEIFRYKNKEGKKIIVYDEDENVASKAATTFFQKGVDNIFMLSGGLRDMAAKFPNLVLGKLPPKPDTPTLNSRSSYRAVSASSMASRVSKVTSKTSASRTNSSRFTNRPASTQSTNSRISSQSSTSQPWK